MSNVVTKGGFTDELFEKNAVFRHHPQKEPCRLKEAEGRH